MSFSPPLNLFVAALLLASAIPSPAEVQVDDCVVSGPLPNEEILMDSTPLNHWPEEVRYSSGSISASPQIAGTILQNSPYISPDSDFSLTSRVVGQIFNIPPGDGDQVLEKIFITARVGLRNKTPLKFQARLVDLGESPDIESYEAGTNLLDGSPKFEAFTPTSRDDGQIISFTFTDKDRVRLKEGHWYAFEIASDPDNIAESSLTWLRCLGSKEMPDAPVFRVPFVEGSSAGDSRTVIKGRQAFIGIKTSPAN